MTGVIPDIRYAFRQLARSPFFSSISIALLAVGIGVNAALVSFIDTRLAHPVAGVPNPEGLVDIEILSSSRTRSLTWAEFLELRDRQTVFENIATAVNGGSETVDIAGDIYSIGTVYVSGEYFAAMRPSMEAGAGLPTTDDRGGRPEPVAVVSYLFWRTKLAGDSAAIGRTIRVNRVPVTVVGVLPRGFNVPSSMPNNMELWLPLGIEPLINPPRPVTGPARSGAGAGGATAAPVQTGPTVTDPVARLRPGVSAPQASAAVSSILSAIGGTYRPQAPLTGASVRQQGIEGTEIVIGSVIIGNITILILLTACANVSILLLGRAVSRRREIAVRLALGAKRSRVVRLLVVESVLLALLACSGGLLIAHWILEYFNAGFPAMGMDYAISWRSAIITLVFATATGTLFGLTPALHATRADVGAALKTGSGATDGQRSRLQRVFVVAEVAMSMALVCAAWLMVKAYGGPGGGRPYELSHNVLIANVTFSRTAGETPYTAARADALLSQARARIAGRPSVKQASFGNAHPQGEARADYGFIASPQATGASTSGLSSAAIGVVDPDFFAASGIRLRDGRDFARVDSAGSARVVVVTPSVATVLWPGSTALGKILMVGQTTRVPVGARADTTFVSYSVIGVVDDLRSYAGTFSASYGRPVGMVYLSRLQLSPTEGVRPSRDMTLVVRTVGDAREQASSMVQELRALDPDLLISGVRTTRQRYAEQAQAEIAMANGISLAGMVALFMASVGVYAVIAFGVDQRTREIGIRMALGARRSQVVSLFFRDGMRLALVGFVIGIPLSLIAMKLSLGRESDRILTLGSVLTVVVGLLAVAAIASWLPARRAAGVDPMSAARSE